MHEFYQRTDYPKTFLEIKVKTPVRSAQKPDLLRPWTLEHWLGKAEINVQRILQSIKRLTAPMNEDVQMGQKSDVCAQFIQTIPSDLQLWQTPFSDLLSHAR